MSKSVCNVLTVCSVTLCSVLTSQVRSLAAESDRAYQGGPLERTFYRQASLTVKEGGVEMDATGFHLPNQYSSMLDWFAVDLEGEHSAMDGRILEEHTEYVVYAIHRVLLLLLRVLPNITWRLRLYTLSEILNK